jgi:hypothetical protein
MGLVCQSGTCTTSCEEDRDCTTGAVCRMSACEDLVESCLYNTDCPAPLVCGFDQLCRYECITDRDCITPRRCSPETFRCELPERLDGGP